MALFPLKEYNIRLQIAQYTSQYAIRNYYKLEEPVMDWNRVAQDELAEALKVRPIFRQAKNVILFMGDGMGFSNNAASRVYRAQREGTSFKDARLTFEKFPHVGLSLTYCTDRIVTDSAAAATAYLCGEKTRAGMIGVNQHVYEGDCEQTQKNKLTSILKHSHNAGKMTGVISTARITHASPAATYANSGSRRWEADSDMPRSASQCKDIARQLVEDASFINVVLAGGRQNFLPNTTMDPEYPTRKGKRADGRNLIQEWQNGMGSRTGMEGRYKYVQNLDEFNAADPEKLEHLFGLFEPSHMHYEVDRTNTSKNKWSEPSIATMTEKAIKTLSKADKGYFLFVEAGRIDHAHHDNNAFRALNDTVVFSAAIQKALDMTDVQDTLILVTADHSHAFILGGRTEINSDILGIPGAKEFGVELVDHQLTFAEIKERMDAEKKVAKAARAQYLADKAKSAAACKRKHSGLATIVVNGTEVIPELADDGLPYTVLTYSNGPGYTYHHTNGSLEFPIRGRKNLTEDGASGKSATVEYLQESPVPMKFDTHGGEEVPLYGLGPLAHLVTGTHEQPYIAHLVMYASCVGPPGFKSFCDEPVVGAAGSAMGGQGVGYALMMALVVAITSY